MENKALESLINDITLSVDNDSVGTEADYHILTAKVNGYVKDFIKENHLAQGGVSDASAVVGAESLGDALIGMGSTGILDLVDTAGVPQRFRKEAAVAVANVIAKHSTSSKSGLLWNSQLGGMENFSEKPFVGNDLAGIYGESLYNSVLAENAQGSFESFGVDMDKATPDLKMDIVVALMRFHADLTALMLPIRPTSQPAIKYIKELAEVYDLGDINSPVTQLIDLYEDPSVVDTVLKSVIPIKTNNPTLVAEDGVLFVDNQVNLLELSIKDAPGYTKINRTDLLADGVKVKAVYVTINDGTDEEEFRIAIPDAYGRLTRNSNNGDVAERMLNAEFDVYMTNGQKLADGSTSVIFGKAGSEVEGAQLRLLVSSKINLKTSVGYTQVGVSIKKHKTTDAAYTGGWDTEFAAIEGGNVVALKYEIDAKYSEENMRKTNIAVRTARQAFEYEIPTGRNYALDYSLAQGNAQSNAATLTKVIRIGQGHRVLTTIIDVLKYVNGLVTDYKAGRLPTSAYPGKQFVAGSKVRPFVVDTVMDLTNLKVVTDSGRSGDIKERALLFLNSVIAEIESNSFYDQQLSPGTTPHYTLITSNFILNNVLNQKHTHDHLDKSDEATTGIEYRLVTPSGVTIECITTTDKEIDDRIILYPSIPSSKESVLNFGHNWDYGTMVGHYTVQDGGRGANNRLFANTRELPIPTCPTGAIITVEGALEAVRPV